MKGCIHCCLSNDLNIACHTKVYQNIDRLYITPAFGWICFALPWGCKSAHRKVVNWLFEVIHPFFVVVYVRLSAHHNLVIIVVSVNSCTSVVSSHSSVPYDLDYLGKQCRSTMLRSVLLILAPLAIYTNAQCDTRRAIGSYLNCLKGELDTKYESFEQELNSHRRYLMCRRTRVE